MNNDNEFRVGDIVRFEGTVTCIDGCTSFVINDRWYVQEGFVLVERPEPKISVELTLEDLTDILWQLRSGDTYNKLNAAENELLAR